MDPYDSPLRVPYSEYGPGGCVDLLTMVATCFERSMPSNLGLRVPSNARLCLPTS